MTRKHRPERTDSYDAASATIAALSRRRWVAGTSITTIASSPRQYSLRAAAPSRPAECRAGGQPWFRRHALPRADILADALRLRFVSEGDAARRYSRRRYRQDPGRHQGKVTGRYAELAIWRPCPDLAAVPGRGISAKHVGDRDVTDENDAISAGYTLVDLDAQTTLRWIGLDKTYFQLNVINLFDKRYYSNVWSAPRISQGGSLNFGVPTNRRGDRSFPVLNLDCSGVIPPPQHSERTRFPITAPPSPALPTGSSPAR